MTEVRLRRLFLWPLTQRRGERQLGTRVPHATAAAGAATAVARGARRAWTPDHRTVRPAIEAAAGASPREMVTPRCAVWNGSKRPVDRRCCIKNFRRQSHVDSLGQNGVSLQHELTAAVAQYN